MAVTPFEVQLEQLARNMGLNYFPVEFEVVPPSFMMEVAVYGLPVRMPHWSFGVRYIHQLVQHRMGHSRIFEVVFPGNPGHAFMSNDNSDVENTLVYAHVLGHADFSKNNELFVRSQRQVGHRIVELAAGHAQRIADAIEEHGQQRVERVIDAALALEQHIDTNQELQRPRYETASRSDAPADADAFRARYEQLPGQHVPPKPGEEAPRAPPVPPHPEQDLLWFIAQYAPEMADWERDIFLSVREESYYFYPVFACQIMNEGWASYWHARLLREASFLPQHLFVDAMKTHSDVVRPVAADNQVALSINPYHLGFSLWDRIVERVGIDEARAIMSQEDDFGFVRNHLDAEMAEELGLFVYEAKRNGQIKVVDRDIDRVREAILSPRFNFGSPSVAVSELGRDGSLILTHDTGIDSRGLDETRARRVLEYVHEVWRRPVSLHTVDAHNAGMVLSVGGDAD